MIPKLSARFSTRAKKLIRTLSSKTKPRLTSSHHPLLPVLSCDKKSASNFKKLLALGLGLVSISDPKKDEPLTIAPGAVTADPTKKPEPLPHTETKAKQPAKAKNRNVPGYLPYPGTYERIDHDAKDVLDNIPVFVGGRIMALTGLQEKSRKLEVHLDVQANPMIQRTGHASTLMVHGQLGHDYALQGKVSGNGRVEGSATFLQLGLQGLTFTPHFKVNPNSQYNALSFDLQQRGADYHMTGTLDSKTLTTAYLQTVYHNPDVAIGLQLIAMRPLFANHSPALIPAIRYRNVEKKIGDIITFQFLPSQYTCYISYVRKESQQLSLATQFFLMGQTRESGWAVAAKFDTMKFLYNAKIAHDGTVTVCVEYLVTPNVKLNLSGELVHFQSQGQQQPPGFGVGLTVMI